MTDFARAARIVIAFRAFWTSGTGEGSGRQSDTRCHRDRRGLPALPMSQVKGTLRETAEGLAKAGVPGITAARVLQLFGGRSEPGDTQEPEPAALNIGEDAIIADDVAAHLSAHKEVLFHRVASTALNEDGVARDRTLRTIEVAVPVVLIGRIQWSAATPPDFDWIDCLDSICAATLAFGKAKRDGYGRALASAEPDLQAQARTAGGGTDSPEIPAGAFLLDLKLAPRRHAVFSGRSATEGAHATLPAPTGAALLGWCAQMAGYGAMTDPLAVYHSGAVSFGDARPAGPSADDEVVPVPATLAVPKGRERAAKSPAGVLNVAEVRNGRPPDGEADEIQYEALRDRLMTERYAILAPKTGQRLRTATRDGRAATGQLFGLQHLAGGPEGGVQNSVFTARIAIGASVDRDDARRIVDAFDGRTLTIGKGRNTGYGGAFACTARILEPGEELLDPEFSGPIRVLALSDIAAVNDFGAPAPMLDPADLGLPGAIFDPQASVLRHRRFAPWNGALGCRDTERQVIEAGSVLSYHVPQVERPRLVSRRQRIGAWQEAGLGAVWLDPPFLRNWELPLPMPVSEAKAAMTDAEGGTELAELPQIDRATRPEDWALIAWAKVRRDADTAKAQSEAARNRED